MGSDLHRAKRFWERAASVEEGRQEISQYDQVVDFVVTENGHLVERFQIEAEKGGTPVL